jgi:hypothetical protein
MANGTRRTQDRWSCMMHVVARPLTKKLVLLPMSPFPWRNVSRKATKNGAEKISTYEGFTTRVP